MPVTVWTGNYTSGKTTAMRQRAEELRAGGIEPVMIDYDDLAQALGSTPTHGHAEHFTRLTQRVRGLAIKLALAEARDGATVLIVDASPTESRWQQYRDAQAEIVALTDVPIEELHRRADAERPPQWHDYIDDWQPTAPDYQAQPQWHKRPTYRKGAAGRRYSAMRARFLRGKTHCENCGQPFVTNASCQHNACLRHGRGCHQHPRYATVEHLDALVDTGGAGVLDTSRWRAWCRHCNSSLGQATGQRRRTHIQDQGHSLDLDW